MGTPMYGMFRTFHVECAEPSLWNVLILTYETSHQSEVLHSFILLLSLTVLSHARPKATLICPFIFWRC